MLTPLTIGTGNFFLFQGEEQWSTSQNIQCESPLPET